MTPRIARTTQVAALLLVLALVPAAFAAKGGRGGGGGTSDPSATISLDTLDAPDGLAHVMHQVTFDVYTTATEHPWVTVDCYDASGTWVYHASNGIFPSSLNQVFTLGSNIWLSGEADCTAYLQNWDNSGGKRGTITNLKSTTFHVYA